MSVAYQSLVAGGRVGKRERVSENGVERGEDGMTGVSVSLTINVSKRVLRLTWQRVLSSLLVLDVKLPVLDNLAVCACVCMHMGTVDKHS